MDAHAWQSRPLQIQPIKATSAAMAHYATEYPVPELLSAIYAGEMHIL
jgi:hypothetical protein